MFVPDCALVIIVPSSLDKSKYSKPTYQPADGCKFPDSFAFAGEFQDGIRQIGNCAPPLSMRAIAGHIRREILVPGSSERAA